MAKSMMEHLDDMIDKKKSTWGEDINCVDCKHHFILMEAPGGYCNIFSIGFMFKVENDFGCKKFKEKGKLKC